MESHRIAYLTREAHPSFRPDLVDLFGKHLPAFGIYSDIVALGDPTAVWSGGSATTRQTKGCFSRMFARFMLISDVYRLARRDCSAVQVRDRMFGGALSLIVARFLRRPFFYWMSFPFPEAWLATRTSHSGLIRGLYWRLRGALSYLILYYFVCRYADHVFVQSDTMLEEMVKKGVRRARMTAVPMGVDMPEDLDEIVPHDDPRLTGRKVIVYLGALERIRQPDVMVRAMSRVTEIFSDTVLCLVGDSQTPGERAWLEELIESLGLRDKVFITGWLSPTVARRYLRAAFVGVSPFPRTGVLESASPTKVCEYLGYGLPVIANDQPDQAWLIEQTGGGLCVPLSAEGFAEGICRLLADPEMAARMGQQGRQRVAALRSYPVIARKLAQTYRTLLQPAPIP